MIDNSPEMEFPGPPRDLPRSAPMNARATRFARRLALLTVVLPFLGFMVSVVILWQRAIGIVDLILLLVFYTLTTLGIGVGYHRLFAHRGFQTSTPIKVIVGILASMAAEGPVLFWVAVHRRHHTCSDRDGDPHSPHLHGDGVRNMLRGFWHAHTGWMFRPELTGWAYYVPDLLRDRVVFQINRLYFLWVTLGLLLPAVIGGLLTWSWRGALLGFLWGGLVRIFLVHHTTWSINSVCHIFGNRPFRNRDLSTNNWWMALLAFGEGWHNNHHAFPSSVRHGLHWWQIDVSGYVIQFMKTMGLAWNLKVPSNKMIEEATKKAALSEGPEYLTHG